MFHLFICPCFFPKLATIGLSSVLTVLPFPECQMVGIMPCVAFPGWFLSLSNTHLRFINIFLLFNTSVLFNTGCILSRSVKSKVAQSKVFVNLWTVVYCSPPASSVYGISQARILEWVAICFSKGSSQPRDGS